MEAGDWFLALNLVAHNHPGSNALSGLYRHCVHKVYIHTQTYTDKHAQKIKLNKSLKKK